MTEVGKRLTERSIDLRITKKAKEHLAHEGYSPMYGARPLKRAIQKYVENPFAEKILEGRFTEGSIVQADLKGDELVFVELSNQSKEASKS